MLQTPPPRPPDIPVSVPPPLPPPRQPVTSQRSLCMPVIVTLWLQLGQHIIYMYIPQCQFYLFVSTLFTETYPPPHPLLGQRSQAAFPRKSANIYANMAKYLWRWRQKEKQSLKPPPPPPPLPPRVRMRILRIGVSFHILIPFLRTPIFTG
jgi:hypothetical protein